MGGKSDNQYISICSERSMFVIFVLLMFLLFNLENDNWNHEDKNLTVLLIFYFCLKNISTF